MSLLILCCVWHAIVSQLNNNNNIDDDNNDTAEFADNIALGVLGGLFLLLQFSFVIYWRVAVSLPIFERYLADFRITDAFFVQKAYNNFCFLRCIWKRRNFGVRREHRKSWSIAWLWMTDWSRHIRKTRAWSRQPWLHQAELSPSIFKSTIFCVTLQRLNVQF